MLYRRGSLPCRACHYSKHFMMASLSNLKFRKALEKSRSSESLLWAAWWPFEVHGPTSVKTNMYLHIWFVVDVTLYPSKVLKVVVIKLNMPFLNHNWLFTLITKPPGGIRPLGFKDTPQAGTCRPTLKIMCYTIYKKSSYF